MAGEGHTDRGVAFRDEGDALDGADQRLLVDDRVNRIFVGVQAVHRREFPIDQLRGGDAARVLESQQRRVLRIEIDHHVLVFVDGACDIAQQRAADQRGGVDVGIFGGPVEARPGQTETVGGAHDHPVALELHADAGQHRAVLFAGDRHGCLVHGLHESRGVYLAEFGRNGRQIGVFGIRHELHGEGRFPGADDQGGTFSGKVGFGGRQRLRDIGEQFAKHQDRSRLVNAGFDVVAGGNGVIERGKLERAVNGLQTDAGKNRRCGTRIDDAGSPGYSVGQCLGIDFDFH